MMNVSTSLGLSNAYFSAMKKSCPEKYRMIFPEGFDEQSMYSFIERTKKLRNEVISVFEKLKNRGELKRFGEILTGYGVFGNPKSIYTFFDNLYLAYDDTSILKMRSTTIKKMERIVQIYKFVFSQETGKH